MLRDVIYIGKVEIIEDSRMTPGIWGSRTGWVVVTLIEMGRIGRKCVFIVSSSLVVVAIWHLL